MEQRHVNSTIAYMSFMTRMLFLIISEDLSLSFRISLCRKLRSSRSWLHPSLGDRASDNIIEQATWMAALDTGKSAFPIGVDIDTDMK